jgi:hypothetical protein
MTNGQIAKDVYRRYKLGDTINDDELLIAQEYFSDVGSKLTALGDVFWLAGVEAWRVAMGLRDYAKARGIWYGD